jgi:hypothetical protein
MTEAWVQKKKQEAADTRDIDQRAAREPGAYEYKSTNSDIFILNTKKAGAPRTSSYRRAGYELRRMLAYADVC